MAEPGSSSTGRITVLVTSPRLPAGLLSADAWNALHRAAVVAAAGTDGPLARALVAAELDVVAWPDASAAQLVDRVAGGELVWLAAEDGDERLIGALAAHVVERSESGAAGPEIEVLVGSFDPVGARLLDLVEVMDRLRQECPWDREQTHESLVRYLVEETYETVEAIESGDRAHLREELGDLLLQVMFHARVASEGPTEPFAIDDVAAGIVEKLVRRHPHVFADASAADAAEVERSWEQIKAVEKGRDSVLEGIPAGLPALSLADKVIGRAIGTRGGLSVPSPAETSYTTESLGEVLFALVAAGRAAGIDAEQALRARVRREMADVRADEQRAGRGAPPAPPLG